MFQALGTKCMEVQRPEGTEHDPGTYGTIAWLESCILEGRWEETRRGKLARSCGLCWIVCVLSSGHVTSC